nr:MAG TPA: hypothetical protein [Caudoviricetes sp.]
MLICCIKKDLSQLIDLFLPYIIVFNVADYDLRISNMAFCHLKIQGLPIW